MKTLCVTGHRPDGLNWQSEEDLNYVNFINQLNNYIDFAISQGVTNFICGGALGIDTIFAKNIIERKKANKNISLEVAVPCKNQDKFWKQKDKKIYAEMLDNATIATCLSPVYTNFCMQKRNEYMVDKSDIVLCCWNGAKQGGTYSTIKYAEKKNKPILFIKIGENDLPQQISFLTYLYKIT